MPKKLSKDQKNKLDSALAAAIAEMQAVAAVPLVGNPPNQEYDVPNTRADSVCVALDDVRSKALGAQIELGGKPCGGGRPC